MKCRKCKYTLEKGWKYCPMCSETVPNYKYIFVIVGVLLLLIIIGTSRIDDVLHENVKNNTDNDPVKQYLQTKYNKSFSGIKWIKTVRHPGTTIDLDGSEIGPFNFTGEKIEYYKAYSSDDSIVFIVSFDTETEEYNDTYESYVEQRQYMKELFEKVNYSLTNYVVRYDYYRNLQNYDATPSTITSIDDLDNSLSYLSSNIDNEYITKNELHLYVNANSIDLCKTEYDKIKDIHSFLQIINGNKLDNGSLNFYIHTIDEVKLNFNDTNNVYIHEPNSEIPNKTIDEFIQRSEY